MSKIKMRLRDKDPIKLKLKNAVQKMYPSLENLYVVPSGEVQTFKSEKHYGYENVTVGDVKLQKKELTLNKNGVYNIVADDNYTGLSGVEVTLDAIEDLDNELNTYNEELTEQETTVQELVDLLKTKGIGEKPKYSPRIVSFAEYTGTELNSELENLETSNLVSARNMFYKCSNLTELDVSNFDTSNITDMRYMFGSCGNITELDVSNFDTSKVTDMYGMFNYCKKLSVIDISNFDTSNVTDMSYMFSNCSKVTNLDLAKLDVSKVTNMQQMLSTCSKITNFDVSNWNVSNVTNMYYLFGSNNYNLVDLDLSTWDASKVNYIYDCFGYLFNLTNLKFMNNLGKGYTQKSSNYYNYQLNIGGSSKLTHDSLMSIINNLYDLNLTYNVANGGTLYTQRLSLSSSNINKLTAEEIAIATNKGWSVS